MNRRKLIAGLASAAALLAAGPALALNYAEDVVKQLTKLGFLEIHVETTLLGRIRITAERADGVREIVLNPRTGEILRDVWSPASGGEVRNVLADVEDDGDEDGDDGHSGSGDNGGDDGGDDSGGGKDDDGGDDNSGSGGSGGGDDDSGSDDGGRDDRGGKDREDREDREDGK